jgi:hypothetical protein
MPPSARPPTSSVVTDAVRLAGFANIEHGRRCLGHDDRRILALYGFGYPG